MGTNESREIQRRSQFDEIVKYIEQISPVITDDVLETLVEASNAEVIHFSNLENKEDIVKRIEQIFDTYALPNVNKFLVETAKDMIFTIQSNPGMKGAMYRQEREQIIKVGNKTIGLEIHYQVKMLEEEPVFFSSSRVTTVIVGYKVYVHKLSRGSCVKLDSTVKTYYMKSNY